MHDVNDDDDDDDDDDYDDDDYDDDDDYYYYNDDDDDYDDDDYDAVVTAFSQTQDGLAPLIPAKSLRDENHENIFFEAIRQASEVVTK